MVFTLLGFTPVSFTDKSSGDLIDGTRFYFSGDDGSRGLVGLSAFDFFLTSQRLDKLGFRPGLDDIGNEFDILYNRYGKVADIRSVNDRN